MAMRLHPALRWTAALVLLVALVIWVQRTVGWGQVFRAWEKIPATDLGLVIALTLFGQAARAARLAVHFGGELKRAPLRCFRLMAYHNVANNFLPMRTGELSFPLLLKRDFGVPSARAVGALLWLRAMDLSAILVAAGLGLGIDRLGLLPGLAIGIAGLLAPLAGYRLLTGRPASAAGLLSRMAAGLPGSVASLLQGQAFTLVHWGAKLAAWAWILARIGGIDRVLAWTGAVAGELTSVLPIHGIAGAGTYEGGIVLVLGPLGVPVDAALTAATDLHLFMLGFALLVGGLSWALIRD